MQLEASSSLDTPSGGLAARRRAETRAFTASLAASGDWRASESKRCEGEPYRRRMDGGGGGDDT